MKRLTQKEVADLINRVGSVTLIALIAACETRQQPAKWAKGQETPDPDAMERLAVLKEVMDIVQKKKGKVATREWLVQATAGSDQLSSVASSIREGRFEEARIAATGKANGTLSY